MNPLHRAPQRRQRLPDRTSQKSRRRFDFERTLWSRRVTHERTRRPPREGIGSQISGKWTLRRTKSFPGPLTPRFSALYYIVYLGVLRHTFFVHFRFERRSLRRSNNKSRSAKTAMTLSSMASNPFRGSRDVFGMMLHKEFLPHLT